VLDRTDSDSAERINGLVRKLLAKRSLDRAVGRYEDLIESGLSSLDIVNLMLAVEADFDIKIPEQEMTPSNFRTIARIDALIQTLTTKSG